MALEQMFDELGWDMVGPALSVAEALPLARDGTFETALLDINLNGERSWEVAAILQARNVPFAFATAYDVKTILPDWLRGAAVVGKPYRLVDLQQRLQVLMAPRCPTATGR
jgi:chemotaxis family two-component system sensor kinase Cph1